MRFPVVLNTLAVAIAVGFTPITVLAEGMTTKVVLEHHLNAFGAKDIDEVMKDYTEESTLFWDGEVHHGLDELRQVYAGAIDEFTADGVRFEMEKMVTDGRTGLLKWNADTLKNDFLMGTDTYIIEDGKIMIQTVTWRAEPVN
jgi:hypothetical protein